MPVIRTPAKSVDKPALTFEKSGGNSGAAFQSAVIGAIQDNPSAIPQAVASLQITEIAELAQQQDDDLFCRLVNNNVNLRYTNVSGTAGAIPGNPSPNKTFLVFDHKDFNGGGMEQEQNQMYFRSNKCGVYRVSFGMLFDITAGADTVDFAVILERKRPSTGGSTSSNPYSCVFWQAVGTLNKFWANGSDLIELEEGDSVGISMHNGAAGGISAGNYTLSAWIAINYTGNQH